MYFSQRPLTSSFKMLVLLQDNLSVNLLWRRNMEKETFSRKISFLRAGWWIIHFIGIAMVYSLGHILWR